MKKYLILVCLLIFAVAFSRCNDHDPEDMAEYKYEVVSDERANIVYCREDGCEQIIGTSSPWEKIIRFSNDTDLEKEVGELFLSAQILGNGNVTARIYFENSVVAESKVTGDHVHATVSYTE